MNKPVEIDKVLYFPSSPMPITESALRQARMFGGDMSKKSTRGYPINPILWEIPTKNTSCDQPGCGYYGWGFEATFFKAGEPCPGRYWRYDLEEKENAGKKMDYKDVKTYLIENRETNKRPICSRDGKMQTLWAWADTFNIEATVIIDETKRGNDWFVKGQDNDDRIGKLIWKKWFSLEGALKRIPKQLKGHVNVDTIRDSWKSDFKRSAPF